MFTKDQFKVLLTLYDKQRTTEVKSFSTSKLVEECDLHPNTVRKAMKLFIGLGYVAEGVRHKASKSYFITPEGIKKVKELI